MHIKTIMLLFLTLAAQLVSAQTKVSTKHYNLKGKLAVEGYDVVAYFSNKAVKGSSKYSVISNGVLYYFSSSANKAKFLKNPGRYKPQYGGWCAYAMGNSGEKVSVDPETFKIVNGKLYLFYNAYFNNTLNSWNKDEKNLLIKANANWRKITR